MNSLYPAPRFARHDEYFRRMGLSSPCLILDLDAVADGLQWLRSVLPEIMVFYAVKANAEPELLSLLANSGCGFDVASRREIDLCLEAGAEPELLSYGHPVKKAQDIAYAWRRGIRLFAFDSPEELAKIASTAPDAELICRVTLETTGAQWPISRKFGCPPEDAYEMILQAYDLGLTPRGLTFHVGSQQHNPESWDEGVALTAQLFDKLAVDGIALDLLNLGGGLPARYEAGVPSLDAYGKVIRESIARHFPAGAPPQLIIEPGRYLVADAGMLRTEVVLVTHRVIPRKRRWIYVDTGRFGGLAETEGEAICFPIVATRNGKPLDTGDAEMAVIAGPTCDSADIMYEEKAPVLPLETCPGDHLDFLSAGAYTVPYSSVGFNGFPPLQAYCFSGEL